MRFDNHTNYLFQLLNFIIDVFAGKLNDFNLYDTFKLTFIGRAMHVRTLGALIQDTLE